MTVGNDNAGRRQARLRTPRFAIVSCLAVLAAAPAVALAGSNRPHNGLYAPKANPRLSYSNGAVDLTVFGNGKGLSRRTGVACYTGNAPIAGVPADDELTISIPKPLPIRADGSFAFSGPVTISAYEAQSNAPIHTTFRLVGRFTKVKNGTFTATGSVYSPACQASTPKHFSSPYTRLR